MATCVRIFIFSVTICRLWHKAECIRNSRHERSGLTVGLKNPTVVNGTDRSRRRLLARSIHIDTDQCALHVSRSVAVGRPYELTTSSVIAYRPMWRTHDGMTSSSTKPNSTAQWVCQRIRITSATFLQSERYDGRVLKNSNWYNRQANSTGWPDQQCSNKNRKIKTIGAVCMLYLFFFSILIWSNRSKQKQET